MTAFKKYWYLFLSLSIFAAGVLSAAFGIPAIRTKGDRLSLTAALLGRMIAIEERSGAVERAVKVLDSMARKAPEDLEILIKQAGLEDKVGDKRNSVDRIDDRWSVIVSELSFSDVILSDIDRFISDCRKCRPPWVVEKVTVKSSPFESGRGQVSLSMQALRGKAD